MRTFNIRLVLILTLTICSLQFSQQSKLSKAVNYLSDFIASEYFLNLKKITTDVALMDSMYFRAVEFANNDYSEALLALTFATIPYKEVPIESPIFKRLMYFPLTSTDDSTFALKNMNLPKEFYYDSPKTDYGDKDKLAHFFGNAFLSYSITIFDLANGFGYFVESFEEDFKVQSRVDYRDLEVNNNGALFGELLLDNKSLLPSDIILFRSLTFFSFIQ
ncbi:MAG: hypothetical protein JSW63_07705 [Ignavibacterium sp.]|nr:MAG: hypothetical protein JSW63_07705 [Ignavibacterium sp.]